MDCDLGHPKKLKLVVDLIFEKAVDESKYCRLYALLCRTLNQEVPNYEPDPSPCTTFQKSLMNKLQVIFYFFPENTEQFRLRFSRKGNFSSLLRVSLFF